MTERSQPRKERRILTQSAFDELLAALDPDRERAGEGYERLREKLILFFERRGGALPDEMADDTLTRVAHRIAEGMHMPPGEIQSYVYGVARNVLREGWRARDHGEPLDDLPPSRQPSLDPRKERDGDEARRLECLRRCIEKLEPDERDVVAQYHNGDGRDRIDGRIALATQLGISANALRVKVHRIHRTLEACLDVCLRNGSR